MGEKNDKNNKDAESLKSVEDEKYPYYIFFILGNEFCERYAYYGMRSILVIFLVKISTKNLINLPQKLTRRLSEGIYESHLV